MVRKVEELKGAEECPKIKREAKIALRGLQRLLFRLKRSLQRV